MSECSFPVCPIMGVNIASIDMDMLKKYTVENIRDLSGEYMCVANVHTTVMAYNDPAYREIQNGAVLAIPDGAPLSAVGRKRGFTNMQRTTGPSYLEEMLSKGYSHFFYGATADTLNELEKVIKQKYPKAKIAGMYSPPFREITEAEDAEIIRLINEANADFVWVGLGAPKQERFMAAHHKKIKGFMVGVGAAFDYLSGNIKRAPQWMQKLSLEWLYRLLQQPGKLFKRYLITNTSFIYHAIIKGE